MADAQFNQYNNLHIFAKEWRKYKQLSPTYDKEAFRKNMQYDQYVKLDYQDTKTGRPVFIYLLEKNSKYSDKSQDLRKLLAKNREPADIILVSYMPFKTYAVRAILTFRHLNVKMYLHENFDLIIPNGPLCYPHRILSRDEANKLLNDDLCCYLTNLPKIYVEDVQCIWIGVKIGDIVEITMASEISGESIQYRVAVPRNGRIIPTMKNKLMDNEAEADAEDEVDAEDPDVDEVAKSDDDAESDDEEESKPKSKSKKKTGSNEVDTTDTTEKTNAYATLIMGGDAYLPGALVVGYSLQNVGTIYDTICMVTPDVSDEAKTMLSHVYNKVVEVPVIQYDCKPMMTDKQRDMYSNWIDRSFTKWNILKFTEYNKVMFIDSDKVVLRNMDELFELQTPAGTFSSPWVQKNYYQQVAHGELVPRKLIEKSLNEHGVVCIGTTLIVEPTEGDFDAYIDMMDNAAKPYGSDKCFSGYDEQSIAQFYISRDIPWTHIDQKYNFIPWHAEWLKDPAKDRPTVFHYFGKDKPWNADRSKWIDYEPWWIIASMLVNNVNAPAELRKVFSAKNLSTKPATSCSYCKELKRSNWQKHSMMDTNGKLTCPLLK